MPKQFSQTQRTTFNKGLLTEFSELSFPNEASIDELNCNLFKAGNRSRRLGLDYEFNYALSDNTYNTGILYGTNLWENVAEQPDVEFVVVQAGNYLIFYKKDDGGLSPNQVNTTYTSSVAYRVDLNVFKTATGTPESSHVDVASIKGRLVVVSPQIEPFYIERSTVDGSFTETLIDFKVRDFSYQTDRSVLTTADASPDDARKYDTYNTGWVGTLGSSALSTYEASESEYPPLTHPWYSGKNSSGTFAVAEWQKVYSGNSLIVNGHYILDLFNKDRQTASGLANVENEVQSKRFKTVAAFAGRVFFSGVDSRIYFSRILEDFSDIGNLYQLNDPTSEEISDILDTDGGYLEITEAFDIKKLHAFGSSLLVFADNGVWRVSGVDGVFRATEFSVFKVTDEGLAMRKGFVPAQNSVPFWWSYTGIHTVQVTDEGGVVEVNVSRDTIQTFWDNISGDAKAFVQGTYNSKDDIVIWMYPNEGETQPYKLNRMLLLDAGLGAFYPWQVSDKASVTPYVTSIGFYNAAASTDTTFNVVDTLGNQVVDSLGNTVVANANSGVVLAESSVRLLTVDQNTGKLTWSVFASTDFLDWGTTDYSSYAESAYNFVSDLGRYKVSPFITVFMRMTESSWTSNGDGTYSPVRDSSLRVSAYWDFRNSNSSVKQEAYKYKYTSTDGTYPQDVMMTRLKLRGRGRVMRLRFESSEGKDFNLLGWETFNATNGKY